MRRVRNCNFTVDYQQDCHRLLKVVQNRGFKILQCAVPFTLLFWDGENPHIVQYFFLTSSQAAQHFGITELLFDGIFQH